MDVIPQLLRALEARGFQNSDSQLTPGWLTVTGALSTRFGPVLCEVLIDRSHQLHPRVRLLQTPAQLQPIAPHIMAGGVLCYVAASTEVVDIFDPIGHTLLSLDRAAFVLDRVMAKELVEDLVEEFFTYWVSDIWCLSDVERKESGELALLALGGLMVFTDDVNRSKEKLQGLGSHVIHSKTKVVQIRTDAKPRPSQRAWPPRTVADILSWQQELDDQCRKKIKRHILAAYQAGQGELLIIIETPTMPYGFLVSDLQDVSAKGLNRVTSEPIYDRPIVPVNLSRIDDQYLVQRNTPAMKSLAGKRIALVGCGTIGGYLAEMLVKGGAGSLGGELILVDNDLLMPSNLGRHRLGFNSIFALKAKALQEEFKHIMPSANVRAFPVDAREANLAGVDLLIDATGEEALGHWLSAQYGKTTPLLHVWIEGAGVAVRTLIRQEAGECCYRCLSDYTQSGEYVAVEGGVQPIFSGHGCEGLFVPFPASVSVQAASLALDTAFAWVNKTPWPTLSTRVVSREHTSATDDCSPPARPGCPACGS